MHFALFVDIIMPYSTEVYRICGSNRRLCARFANTIYRCDMKILRKISAILLASIATLLCACMGNTVTYTIFGGSFWLSDTEAGDVKSVSETCTYNVSFVPEKDSPLEAEFTDESKLVTTLSNETIDGKLYYKFSVELTVKGKYKYGQKEVPVDDFVRSECVFSGISDQLAPVKSSKSVRATGASGLNESYYFTFTTYEQTTTYSGNSAVVTVKPGESIPEELKNLSVSEVTVRETEKKYDKLKKPYIDNELTLFFPRAAELVSGFGASYYSIDALAEKVHTMRLSVNSEKDTTEITVPEFSENGLAPSEKAFACFNATIALSESFAGSPIKLYFAADSAKNRKRLIRMENSLAYSAGSLVYTLCSVR